MPVSLEGIVRVEPTPGAGGTGRCRVVFVVRPTDDTPPRAEPDTETLGAGWPTLEETAELPARGPEVLEVFEPVASGGPALATASRGHTRPIYRTIGF